MTGPAREHPECRERRDRLEWEESKWVCDCFLMYMLLIFTREPLSKVAYPNDFTDFRITFLSLSLPQGIPGERGQSGMPGSLVRLCQTSGYSDTSPSTWTPMKLIYRETRICNIKAVKLDSYSEILYSVGGPICRFFWEEKVFQYVDDFFPTYHSLQKQNVWKL